jgi:hypothetical protein
VLTHLGALYSLVRGRVSAAKRQTRREAGAQSHGPLCEEVAGLPIGGNSKELPPIGGKSKMGPRYHLASMSLSQLRLPTRLWWRGRLHEGTAALDR